MESLESFDMADLSNKFIVEQFTTLLDDLHKAYESDPDILKQVQLSQETFKQAQETNSLLTELKPLLSFKNDILAIINHKGKPKSKQFNFLKNLELFKLNFRFCCNENKNTKKTIVRYLSNLLTILELTNSNSLNDETINNLFKDFGLPNGINGVEKLLKNDSIMNLAEKVSKDIQSQNINPMDLMSGLMSGKNILSNKKIANLVNNLSKEIETKVESGELNLKDLGLSNLTNPK